MDGIYQATQKALKAAGSLVDEYGIKLPSAAEEGSSVVLAGMAGLRVASDVAQEGIEGYETQLMNINGTVVSVIIKTIYVYETVGGGGGTGAGPAAYYGGNFADRKDAGEDYGSRPGFARGLSTRVRGAGSGDVIPFSAMVEPGEMINIIPKKHARHMDVSPNRNLTIITGDINNGMDLAVLKHNVIKWSGESIAG